MLSIKARGELRLSKTTMLRSLGLSYSKLSNKYTLSFNFLLIKDVVKEFFNLKLKFLCVLENLSESCGINLV